MIIILAITSIILNIFKVKLDAEYNFYQEKLTLISKKRINILHLYKVMNMELNKIRNENSYIIPTETLTYIRKTINEFDIK